MSRGAIEDIPIPSQIARGSPVALRIVTAAGCTVGALGSAVLAGWWLGVPRIVHVYPAFAPMMPNTALAFLACGVAILAASRDRDRVAAAFAAFVFLVGLLTLAEYTLGVDLGIDASLVTPSVVVEASRPGRMAPNTALGLTIGGAAFLVIAIARERLLRIVVFAIFGTLVAALGAVTIGGYLQGSEAAYRWGRAIQMALHTGVAFFALGLSMMAEGWRRTGCQRIQHRWLGPLALVFAGAVAVLLLLRAVIIGEPDSAVVSASQSPLAVITVGASFVTIGLVGFLMFMAQDARVRAAEIESSRRLLEAEIEGRERAEASTRENQARFRRMAEQSDQIFWMMDLDPLRVEHFSPEIERIWGIPVRAEGNGVMHALWRRIVEEDRPVIIELFGQAVYGPSEASYRVVRADGAERWVRTRVFPLSSTEDQVVSIGGVTEDVTDRKLAEQRLQFLHDFQRLITGFASQMVNVELSQLDAHIEGALGTLARFADVDRAGICLFSENGMTISDTHEWCAEGVPSVKALLQGFPVDGCRWLADKARRGEIFSASVDGLPAHMAEERQVLEHLGIHTCTQVPLVSSGGVIGVVVFVMVSSRATRVGDLSELLRIAAELFTNALERKRAESLLHGYQEKLRSLAVELSSAEERERRRMASALHDGTIQSLGLARLKLCELRAAARREEETAATLDDAITHVERTIAETRSLVFKLSPPVLYELGLAPALEWLADRVLEDYDLPCEFSRQCDGKPVQIETAIVVFRCVSELLLNVHKHARASRARIIYSRMPTAVSVCVEDDGAGFSLTARDQVSPSGGFGLFSIRERVDSMGGSLEIDSAPGRHTRVSVTIPDEAIAELFV